MKLRTIALMLAISVPLWAQTPATTPAADTKDAKPGCCAHMDKMGTDGNEAKMACGKDGKSCCAGMKDKKDGKEAKMACGKDGKMACCDGKDGKDAMQCGKDKDAKAGCCAGMGKGDDKDAAAAMKHDDMHHAAGDKMSCGKDGKSCCGDKKDEKKAGEAGHSCC